MPKTTLNKINLALTVVFVLLLGANHYVQQANAAFGKPDCPPDNPETVTMYPNPEDCSSYFLCDNFELKLVECPPGLYFCEELNACDWPNDEACSYDCLTGGKGKAICYSSSIKHEDFDYLVCGTCVTVDGRMGLTKGGYCKF